MNTAGLTRHGLSAQGKKLVGNLSVSDLRGLKAEEFPLLLLSAAEFALVVHGKGATKEEALAGKRIQVSKNGLVVGLCM